MRLIIVIAMFLTACSKQAAEPGLTGGTFAGAGRDRMCIAGKAVSFRAGFITYGAGDVNCSASGSLERAGQGWVLIPKGEGDCRIPLEIKDETVRIGKPPAACSYYCGPAASMEGKGFNRLDKSETVTDLAGDPLC